MVSQEVQFELWIVCRLRSWLIGNFRPSFDLSRLLWIDPSLPAVLFFLFFRKMKWIFKDARTLSSGKPLACIRPLRRNGFIRTALSYYLFSLSQSWCLKRESWLSSFSSFSSFSPGRFSSFSFSNCNYSIQMKYLQLIDSSGDARSFSIPQSFFSQS